MNSKRCLPHWPPCWSDHCRATAWKQKLALGGEQRRRSLSGRCWCERNDGLCRPSCGDTTTHQSGAIFVSLKQKLQDSLPAGLLIKVLPYPGVRLDCHKVRHVHLLNIMGGGQHYLIGVSLWRKHGLRKLGKTTSKTYYSLPTVFQKRRLWCFFWKS